MRNKNELSELIDFLNEHYAADGFNRVSLDTVRELAGSCVTGCAIGYPSQTNDIPQLNDFSLALTRVHEGQHEWLVYAHSPRVDRDQVHRIARRAQLAEPVENL